MDENDRKRWSIIIVTQTLIRISLITGLVLGLLSMPALLPYFVWLTVSLLGIGTISKIYYATQGKELKWISWNYKE